MKSFPFSSCLLLALGLPCWGHPYTPPSFYLSRSDNVLLVKVTVPYLPLQKNEQVTFSVTETLKGKPCTSLTLIPVAGMFFHSETEWVLVHTSGALKDNVGEEQYQVSEEWCRIPVLRDGDTPYVETGASPEDGMVLDIFPNGTRGLTLEHIKQLLKYPPSKP